MKQFGMKFGGKFCVLFLNEKEGDAKDFNSQEFAISIPNEDFEKLMNIAAKHLSEKGMTALQGKKNTLITNALGYSGDVSEVWDILTEETTGYAITKMPRVPKASELSGYWDDGCWWKPLPVGYGFRPSFRCVEIGVLTGIKGEDGEIIYRVREYHHGYVGDEIIRTKGNWEERDLFGSCLYALYGPAQGKRGRQQIREAQKLMRSGYINWGISTALKEVYAEMAKDATTA